MGIRAAISLAVWNGQVEEALSVAEREWAQAYAALQRAGVVHGDLDPRALFAGPLWAYALTVAVWTLAEIVNSPTQMELVVRLSPVQGRGRYQGMYTMSWSVAALVAPLMAGYVVDWFGAAWLWGSAGVLGTILGLKLITGRIPGAARARSAGPGAGGRGARRHPRARRVGHGSQLCHALRERGRRAVDQGSCRTASGCRADCHRRRR